MIRVFFLDESHFKNGPFSLPCVCGQFQLPIVSVGFHVTILLQSSRNGVPGAVSMYCIDGSDEVAAGFERGQRFVGKHGDTPRIKSTI